jgi:signal transduction histidine kinase
MDMFAVDDDLARWKTSLPGLHDGERVQLLLPLAWHLRQRDTRRALELAQEALALLPAAPLAPEQRTLAAARMALVRAESNWLNGALDDALAQAETILATCAGLSDRACCADAHWLTPAIAVDRGDHGAIESGFARAAEAARRGGDGLRALLAEAALARFAVDRTTEQRREFNLLQVCRESIATMMNRIRSAGHVIDLRIADNIVLDSYPGPFGQVIANFINNALLHAFRADRPGRMVLAATAIGDGRVLVEFRDNGVGIPPDHLTRIFDPFFTTRLGQGGSGLGLSISYNIVTAVLGGQVGVASSNHAGTSFTLDLPLCAPRQCDAGAALQPTVAIS